MNETLIKFLFFFNVVNGINTFINVLHKMGKLYGPTAHIAMAILSMIALLGYSGILNTIFLRRKFHFGRYLYLFLAMLSQIIILILSILSFANVMTYFDAIAIIHAFYGFITIINFTAAVLVVAEQQEEMNDQTIDIENEKL